MKNDERHGEEGSCGSTMKESILNESLKLFSTNGFDAVSTRMIARAVGASDAVIYKHFKSKQDIFDSIVIECKERYFTRRSEVDVRTMNWDDVEGTCMRLFTFQTTNEWIVMFRRLLMVEQFKNPEIASLYREIFVDTPLKSMTEMFGYLIGEGYMKPGNPKVYAIEFYAPFYMYHSNSGDSEHVIKNLEEHIRIFRENVRTKMQD